MTLTRNDANDIFAALLRSRDVTPDQLIALASLKSRSFDDEAEILNSFLTSRSEDGSAWFRHQTSQMARDLGPDVSPYHAHGDELVTEMQARSWLDNRHLTVSQSIRDVTLGQLAARDNPDDFLPALRDVIPKQKIEARSKAGNAIKKFFTKTLTKTLKKVWDFAKQVGKDLLS